MDEFSLGPDTKAEDVYNRLASARESVVDMGRRMAELTIPSVFPPDAYKAGDDLPSNNQSLGAQCVNSLASALMFMAFPPGQPIVRFEAIEYEVQAAIDQDPELWAKMQLALSRLEIAHRKRFATTTLATAYTGYLKLLIVAGNALWKQMSLEEPTFHRPDCYVVRRNAGGQVLLVIHKETVSLQSMDADLRDFVEENAAENAFANQDDWEKEVTVYSCQTLHTDDKGEKTWRYWQEFEGQLLPETHVETDFDNPVMHAGWLIPVYGDNWGRGHCEEYRGDLYSVEASASSVNDGASAAGLSLIFVKPGSSTSARQVREAKNLEVLPGAAEDITMFRTDKQGDYNFVLGHQEGIGRRLAAAFLLQSSVQRSGERVTAEEIRRLGQELDKALGGLYTTIAQGNQRIIILRNIRLNEEANRKLPKLPEEVDVQVVTGIDALGQSTEADSLMEYARAGIQAFPATFEKAHSASDFFTRLAAAKGIKPDGLVKSADTMAQEAEAAQQAQMGMSMIDKGTAPAVKGMADMLQSMGPPTPA